MSCLELVPPACFREFQFLRKILLEMKGCLAEVLPTQSPDDRCNWGALHEPQSGELARWLDCLAHPSGFHNMFFHLLKRIFHFPLLALQGIYHYTGYVS